MDPADYKSPAYSAQTTDPTVHSSALLISRLPSHNQYHVSREGAESVLASDGNSSRKKSRLVKRNKPIEELTYEELYQLHKEYKQYRLSGGALRELRLRIEKTVADPKLKLATPEQISRFKYLQQGYNAYAVQHKARRDGTTPRSKDPEWNNEERADHRKRFNAYHREFMREPDNLTKIKELQQQPWEKLSVKEQEQLKRYERLRDGYLKHQRTKDAERREQQRQQRQNQGQDPRQPSSCMDSALLKYYRDCHNQFRREFVNSPRAKQRARFLDHGGGTQEEQDHYSSLRRCSNAYQRLLHRQNNPNAGEGVDIEFDISLANYIPELEELRPQFNMYRQFFSGLDKAAWREALEAGIGKQSDVELFRELRPKYLEFWRLYHQALRRARQCLDSEDSKVTMKAEEGRPRWFRRRGPNDAPRKITRPKQTGNVIVTEPTSSSDGKTPGLQRAAPPSKPFGIQPGSILPQSDIVERGAGLVTGLVGSVAGAVAGKVLSGAREGASVFSF